MGYCRYWSWDCGAHIALRRKCGRHQKISERLQTRASWEAFLTARPMKLKGHLCLFSSLSHRKPILSHRNQLSTKLFDLSTAKQLTAHLLLFAMTKPIPVHPYFCVAERHVSSWKMPFSCALAGSRYRQWGIKIRWSSYTELSIPSSCKANATIIMEILCRRHFLKTILQSSSKSANAVMSDNVALNRLVARSEEELAELNVLNCDSSPPRVCDNGHQQVCITNSQALWDRQKNACASAGTKTKKTFEQQRIDSIVLNGSCNTHSYTAPLKTSEQGKRCEEKLELGNQAMNMKESPHMSRQADWEEIQPLVAAAEAKASPFTESASFGRGKRRRILGRCKEPDDLEFWGSLPSAYLLASNCPYTLLVNLLAHDS